MKKFSYLPIVILIILCFYLPALDNFFSADDWFHLRIANINSFGEFFQFFSFNSNSHTASFYRPLPTQVFFFFGQKLFGLNSFWYYLAGLFLFANSLWLVHLLAYKLSNSRKVSLLTLLFYGLSVSNFTRVYFLSAYQEIFLVIFCLSSIYLYLNQKHLPSLIFFILGLMSKETAIVTPVLIYLATLVISNARRKPLLLFLPISIGYLYLRYLHFGLPVGDSYHYSIAPKSILNTLVWYVLWSIGAPETLVDYLGSGFVPIARFYTDFPVWSFVILFLLIATFGLLFLNIIKAFSITKDKVVAKLFFLVAISPLLILPAHKFSLELGLPLFGFTLLMSLIVRRNRLIAGLFVVSYLSLNLSMNLFTYSRHYSVTRSEIARRIVAFFQKNYPQYPTGSSYLFINDTADFGKEWGSSKQIANIAGGSELFRVIYNNPTLIVYYQDLVDRPLSGKIIPISTRQFIQGQ